MTLPIRLNIGGNEVRQGWKILDARPGPGVDYVGNCTSLGQFADNSIEEIYAAHVLEHLSYQGEIAQALREMRRALIPGGVLRLSVPDLDVLCRIFVSPDLSVEQRFYVMRMIFGGQINPYDLHKTGLNWDFLSKYLAETGFTEISRVAEFGVFLNDCSSMRFNNQLISLNVLAIKPWHGDRDSIKR
jgi:predicted SAM-dependent methyltransferase